ncbi:MAG: hypothetical protein ABID54_03455 [Pseudomonadota bacterium]
MRTVATVLIGLSALGFVLAAIAGLLNTDILRVGAFGFSYGSVNLSLIAIALCLWLRGGGKES